MKKEKKYSVNPVVVFVAMFPSILVAVCGIAFLGTSMACKVDTGEASSSNCRRFLCSSTCKFQSTIDWVQSGNEIVPIIIGGVAFVASLLVIRSLCRTDHY